MKKLKIFKQINLRNDWFYVELFNSIRCSKSTDSMKLHLLFMKNGGIIIYEIK